MSIINIENLLRKREACINALDENKNCTTCKHKDSQDACEDCYEMMLWMPVNPTNWEAK